MTTVNAWDIPCEDCGRLMDSRVETVYQRKAGWAKMRDAGGTNALALPEVQPVFRCTGCMERARHPGQGTLL